MGLFVYLRSQLPLLIVLAVADALGLFLAVTAGMGGDVAVLVAAVLAAGAVAAFSLDYLRRRSFYRSLDRVARGVERPLWINEIVRRPDFAEGELVYDAMRAVAKAANDNVAAHHRQASDYREYIETWVHEAKSPLAAAHLMSDNLRGLICGGATPGEEDALSKIAGIEEELDRVGGFIEQALFYARSETLDRDYLIRRQSLSHLVSSAIKANADMLIAAHVAPSCRDLGYEVFTDEKWIAFILGQIVQNSVKYARADGASIEFSARLLSEGGADEAVELTIADNGCGVPESDLPRVFEKGFTGSNGRAVERSTGIGLYLVHRLCEKMGVRVSAASREGEGFSIALAFPTNKFHYFD